MIREVLESLVLSQDLQSEEEIPSIWLSERGSMREKRWQGSLQKALPWGKLLAGYSVFRGLFEDVKTKESFWVGFRNVPSGSDSSARSSFKRNPWFSRGTWFQ